jgi:hypothetical protein
VNKELEELIEQLHTLPAKCRDALLASDGALFRVDLMIVGATKRSVSLGHGLVAMVKEKNMICARAILRMQIDTVSRLLAYTYVADPEDMARQVIRGTPLHRFKSREGDFLRDAYLISRMTESHSWVREVYRRTSGEVHFSEQQLLSSVCSVDNESSSLTIAVAPFDDKYPESSWIEVVKCFHRLNEIYIDMLDNYVTHKNLLSPAG